jgi:hypothetical protein
MVHGVAMPNLVNIPSPVTRPGRRHLEDRAPVGYRNTMTIDTQALGELEVQDVTGATVRVGSAWAEGPAVLVFLRHFG